MLCDLRIYINVMLSIKGRLDVSYNVMHFIYYILHKLYMATFMAWKMEATYQNRFVEAVKKLSALQKISFDFGWQTETMLSAVEWLTILTKH